MKKIKVFDVTIVAIMAALAIILERFSFGNGFLKFTFYGFPLMFVGVFMGWKLGLLTGLVAGIIIQLTSPYGITITSPIWALAPISWGFFSGITFNLTKKMNIWLSLFISVLLTSIVSTSLNTLAMFCDSWLIGDSYFTAANILTNLPSRLVSMLVLVFPYTILLRALYTRKDLFSEKNNV